MSQSQSHAVLTLEREVTDIQWHASRSVRHLRLRVPAAILPVTGAAPWCVGDVVSARSQGPCTVLDVCLDVGIPSPGGGDDPEEGQLRAALAAVRDDLARGDRRLLHLVWLAALQHGFVDDDAVEPSVPAGLARLSAHLEVVTDALALSPEMVEVAAQSVGRRPRRTAGELLHREAVLTWERAQAEQAARARRAEEWVLGISEADAAWARQVVRAAGPVSDQVWRQVEGIVLRGRPGEYRRAATVLVALRDRLGEPGGQEFERRLQLLRRRHAGRGVLLTTLDRAGLWGGR